MKRIAVEATALVCGLALAWLGWPRSWDDMAWLMFLFDFPCCIPHVIAYLLAVPLLLVIPTAAGYGAVRSRVFPVGLVVYTVSAWVGLAMYLAHTGDSTEFPPRSYLLCGWLMLAGAVATTAELRWRSRPGAMIGGPLWVGVPLFLLKPFSDIVYAGC